MLEEYKEKVVTVETTFPGKIIGREVWDSRGECVGIVRSIEVDFSTKKTRLIVYLEKGSMEIPLKDIAEVGDCIQLKKPLNGKELEKNDEKKIKRKVKKEIKSILTASSLLLKD